jgi:REP element-mobilizing transposase RayT
MSQPEPLYRGVGMPPRYHLHYSWTAWPSSEKWPEIAWHSVFDSLKDPWESDGLRVMEYRAPPGKIQITFSATPRVSPVFLASRAKGRLQFALRQVTGKTVLFSRKVSVRSIGENQRAQIEAYIDRQVDDAEFVDARFAALLRPFTISQPHVDLASPSGSSHGRYWYNLHLVLVVHRRGRIVDPNQWAIVRDWSLKIAAAKGYAISRLSVMPDHLHIALRGYYEHSPQQIALAFQNNLAFALGQRAIWDDSYYVGTFSEYDMWAIRRQKQMRTVPTTPSGLPDGE